MIDLNNVASALGSIGSVIIAVLILLFMITVHEAGHYLVGKLFGFKINEFAIGMGPAIFKKTKKNGEVFSVRVLPLGGFCAFEGEDEEGNSDVNAFNNKKPWQRILVLIAGATMNFLAAIVIFMLAFGIYGQTSYQAFEVNPSASSGYSIQTNDVITKVNGKTIYLTTDLITALDGKKEGDLVKVEVLRGGVNEDGSVTASNAVRETIDVRLACDPTSKSLQDLSGVLKSLNVATIFNVTESSQTNVNGLIAGDYFLRMVSEKPEFFDSSLIGTDGYTDCVFYEDGYKKYYAINESEYLAEKRVFSLGELRAVLSEYEGSEVYFYVSRVSEEGVAERVLLKYDLTGLTDEMKASQDLFNQFFGIKSSVATFRITSLNVRYGFFESIGRGFINAFKSAGSTFAALGQFLTGKLGLDAIGGPVSTISITSQYVSYGFEYLLQIAGFIGVSLASFNILPIPALDGARAVFVLIEWIRKKPINRKVEGYIHAVGLVLLLAFAVTVDLVKCF